MSKPRSHAFSSASALVYRISPWSYTEQTVHPLDRMASWYLMIKHHPRIVRKTAPCLIPGSVMQWVGGRRRSYPARGLPRGGHRADIIQLSLTLPIAGQTPVIVYNLICEGAHKFEGWFASRDDFDNQLAARKVSCPICASTALSLLPSGPRVGSRPTTTEEERGSTGASQAALTTNPSGAGKLLQWLVEQFENVGSRFPEEARSMHYGEKPHRNIRGQVSSDVAAELREEGIEVVALPPGLDLPEKLN